MPTCDDCTLRLIDRSGGLDRKAVAVHFTFGFNEVTQRKVIAEVQLFDGARAAPLPGESVSGPLAPWKTYGSCEDGEGDVVDEHQKRTRRILLASRNFTCAPSRIPYAARPPNSCAPRPSKTSPKTSSF